MICLHRYSLIYIYYLNEYVVYSYEHITSLVEIYNRPLTVVRSLGPTPATLKRIIISSIHPTNLMTLYNSYNTTSAPYIFVFLISALRKEQTEPPIKTCRRGFVTCLDDVASYYWQ